MGNTIKILVFGILIEDIGNDELEINMPIDVAALKELIINKYPSLKSRQFMVAINKEKAADDTSLEPNDEIALIPPFAGG